MSRDRFDNAHGEDAAPDADALRRGDPLRRALGDAAPPPPMDDVNWMALHARIAAAARPTLDAVAAGRSLDVVDVDGGAGPGGAATVATDQATAAATRPSIWLPLAGWSPLGIPLAAAAAVLLVLGAALLGEPPAGGEAAVASSFRTIEEEFASGMGTGMGAVLAGGSDDMLDAVLFFDGEGW